MIWLVFLVLQDSADPQAVARGEQLFAQNCSVGYCHGIAGAAGRGPRLRGRKLEKNYVYQVTRDGIPQSAMPGWKGRLSEQDLWAVVAYVMSLSGASDQTPAPVQMPPGTGPAAFVEFTGPPQAQPGRELFFDSTRIMRCAACHSVEGRGVAIGPDLSDSVAREASELLSALRSKESQHVLSVRLTTGETFPALRAGQDDEYVRLYDLSSPLPVLRTLRRAEIVSLTPSSQWSHESAVSGYSDKELEAVIPYLAWITTRR